MPTVAEKPRVARIIPLPLPLVDGQRFLIHNVPWSGYEAMLAILGDRPIRVTYDRGDLELMSPSIAHEESGRLLGLFVQALAEELGFPCLGLKSATWRRRLEERGLEADESFYLANAERIVALGKKVDLNVNPPPDLCIEVEITRSALERMPIYEALGVPEVWRYDGETLRVAALGPDGTYSYGDQSPSMPFLPIAEVVRLVALAEGMEHARWGRMIRSWIRHNLPPIGDRPDDVAD